MGGLTQVKMKAGPTSVGHYVCGAVLPVSKAGPEAVRGLPVENPCDPQYGRSTIFSETICATVW